MKKNYPLLLGSQFLSAFGDNAILFIVLGPLTFAFNEGKDHPVTPRVSLPLNRDGAPDVPTENPASQIRKKCK